MLFFAVEAMTIGITVFLLSRYQSSLPHKDKDRKRVALFDMLKGLAIIAIVALHASSIFSDNSVLLEILWGAIPVFIFASGYLLGHRHETITWKPYLTGVTTRIIIIYAVFVISMRIMFAGSTFFSGILLDLLLGRTNNNYYFIPLLLQLYFLFPVLLKYKNMLRKPIVLAGTALLSYGFHLMNYALQTPDWNSNPWSLAFCGRYLFFFVIGIVLSERDLEKMSATSIGSIISVIVGVNLLLSFPANKFYLGFLWPLGTIALFILIARALPAIGKEACSTIGRHSLIIYLVHTRIVFNVLFHIQMTPLIVFLISLIGGVGISYLFSRVFMKGYNTLLKV